MTYTVRNVKTLNGYPDAGEDGYTATIYRDGKRIGTFTCPPNGAVVNDWDIPEKEKKTLVATATPSVVEKDDYVSYSDDGKTLLFMGKPFESQKELEDCIGAFFIEYLVNEYDEAKHLRRWCKTKTIFTLKGDKEGVYRSLKTIYTSKAHARVLFLAEDRGKSVTGLWNEKGVKII